MNPIAKKPKCKSCKIELNDDNKKTHKRSNYCNECYDDIIKEEKKPSEYQLLIGTICDYFNIDKPTGLIVKQIKEYKDTYGYTDGGIGYTLWYIKEIEGKRFDDLKYGIAMIKYYYEKAEQYFIQQSRVRETMRDFKFEENVKVITINKTQKNNRNKFTLNIDDLLK